MSLHQSVATNGKDGRGLKLERKMRSFNAAPAKISQNYYRYCSLMKLVWYCRAVFVLHFVTRDIFGLTCRRSRLEPVIMWHFELSSFSIENRFLMTVHLLENCNFCQRLVFGFEVRMFCQVYRFWSPLLLESYWVGVKSITDISVSSSPGASYLYRSILCMSKVTDDLYTKLADHCTFLGNFPPTPPLSQHFA